jgi:TM2 domain-containing membrane protein YozV
MGGLGWVLLLASWVGLGWVCKLVGWVGLGEEKWTHVHL